jgi:gliding motility-associated lipoprotein GldD
MRYIIPFVFVVLLLASCDEDSSDTTPRPRGYFRIALPAKNYAAYDAECPYRFEIPEYAQTYMSAAPNAAPCWRDIYFKPFRATLYISYTPITNDTMLGELINQSWELVEAHNKMSMGVRDSAIIRNDAKVYGNVITLSGNAATMAQFYLTDSTNHFLHGSLYFYASPNKDSIAPVLNYLKQDIVHIAQTLQWKNVDMGKIKAIEDSLKNHVMPARKPE